MSNIGERMPDIRKHMTHIGKCMPDIGKHNSKFKWIICPNIKFVAQIVHKPEPSGFRLILSIISN